MLVLVLSEPVFVQGIPTRIPLPGHNYVTGHYFRYVQLKARQICTNKQQGYKQENSSNKQACLASICILYCLKNVLILDVQNKQNLAKIHGLRA
jgi:hypothetical protein